MVTPTEAWIAALRPRTLPAAVGPVLVGVALAGRGVGSGWALPDLGLALLGLVGALLLQVASNLANDAFDADRGADGPDRLGPPRAAAMGWLSRRALLAATALAIALALAVGAALVHAGGWPVAAIGLSGALAAVLYTGGPLPLGYLGLGDVLVFGYFGPAAVAGMAMVLGRPVDSATLLSGAAMGALVTAILVVNNLRDRVGDDRVGKRTTAVRFGAAFARAQHGVLLLAPFAAPLVAWALGAAGPGWLLCWLALPAALRLRRAVATTDGAALNPLLAATAALGLRFAVLLAAGVVLDAHLPGLAARVQQGGAP